MRSPLVLALLLSSNVYAGPASKRQSKFVYYNLPTPNSGPCDLTDGPSGTDIWYYNQLNNKYGVIDTKAGTVRDWTLPWTGSAHSHPVTVGKQVAQVCAVRKGSDGLIYIVSNDRSLVAQINPRNNAVRILNPIPYTPPAGVIPALHEMLPYGDSLILTHFYERKVTEFSYNDNSTLTTSYDDQQSILGFQKGLQGYIGGQQQVYWFTEFGNNTIYQDLLTYGQDSKFATPVPAGAYPSSFRATTNKGQYLWANAFVGGSLIRFDTTNKSPVQTYQYSDADGSGANRLYPQQNDVDPSGNVWVSSYNLKRLAYFTPSTKAWTTVSIPVGNTSITGDKFVPVHYGKPLNAIWFTSVGTNQVGAYKL